MRSRKGRIRAVTYSPTLPSFLKRQTESLCTGVHLSKAAVSHYPSSREEQRPRTRLVLQVKPLVELRAVVRGCSPPTAPSSQTRRNFALLGTRPGEPHSADEGRK